MCPICKQTNRIARRSHAHCARRTSSMSRGCGGWGGRSPRPRRDPDPGREGGSSEPAEGLEVVASRPLGGAWLLDALWRRLGIPAALRELLGARRFATDVERVLFRLF